MIVVVSPQTIKPNLSELKTICVSEKGGRTTLLSHT